jgi:hypothetical protein
MSAASGEPLGCRPAYRALCGNLGFLSAADDLSAFRDERSLQLARLGALFFLRSTSPNGLAAAANAHLIVQLKDNQLTLRQKVEAACNTTMPLSGVRTVGFEGFF